MKIGVISEGHSDRAVIVNILIGLTGLDLSDISPIRPKYKLDETDLAHLPENTFGSWTLVRKECIERESIDKFLSIEGQDFVVIHMDTAEADEYGIDRPSKKSEDYCLNLRASVIAKINSWFGENISSKILYAIAIEEINAWILTIYENKDSSKPLKAKEKLNTLLKKKGLSTTSTFDNYLKLSKPFAKKKTIKTRNYLLFNHSLEEFHNEITQKVIPRLLTCP
ncbi:MAG TPA: hypothetical protein VFG10_12715 [Saprospiraceae bacterium]|nr:hypothetical protein [Saprospiraceae bacterium]